MNSLLEILKSESRTITEEFKLASAQGNGTPQEIADFREHAIQNFISRFYPSSHIVSKGKVTDLDGNQSDSIDCLILKKYLKRHSERVYETTTMHKRVAEEQDSFWLSFRNGSTDLDI